MAITRASTSSGSWISKSNCSLSAIKLLAAGLESFDFLETFDLAVALLEAAEVELEVAAFVEFTWATFTAVALALTGATEDMLEAAVVLAVVLALAVALALTSDLAEAFVVWFAFTTLVSLLTAVLTSVLLEDFSATACFDAFTVEFDWEVEFDSNLAMVFSSGTGVFSSPVWTFKLRPPKRPPLNGCASLSCLAFARAMVLWTMSL